MYIARLLCLLVFILTASSLMAQRTDTTYAQALRPQYHFSPKANWINDPNGLVYHDGEYHLFYQHNPFGIRWGHMTWGHAVSRDLVHWTELPPAIAEENGTMIFSGSCVVDQNNTSGFGKNGLVPMVAIYTGHQEGLNQSQHLAFSLDKGRTWTKYAGNPVIDLKQKDFRDPKVFWHEPTKRWIMAVVLPKENKLLIYGSRNLKNWERLSEFTSATTPATIWECPDLLELPVDGTTEKKWVLLMSMGGGAPAGGSGMQYFIGDFDGKTFTSRHSDVRFLDYGKDYYAAITYNNTPRRVSIGWMNNWQYANDIPTTPFRGAMTLPRELRLVNVGNRYELRQRPVAELNQLASDAFQWRGIELSQLNESIRKNRITGDSYVLTLIADVTEDFGVKVRKGDGEETVIGYKTGGKQLYVDRTNSGQVNFKKEFTGRFTAPLQPEPQANVPSAPGRIQLQIWVDRSSVEIFANDGKVTMTNLIFPKQTSQGIEFFGNCLRSVTIRKVDSVWRK
ncbi:levanase [Nibrella viscosa]|uniref:Levanase n=1 Tax=Nibrella viscosa TaxID=1084524 RepID=A0ABP8JXN3_9BACT